jgi:hypothetical protein
MTRCRSETLIAKASKRFRVEGTPSSIVGDFQRDHIVDVPAFGPGASEQPTDILPTRHIELRLDGSLEDVDVAIKSRRNASSSS